MVHDTTKLSAELLQLCKRWLDSCSSGKTVHRHLIQGVKDIVLMCMQYNANLACERVSAKHLELGTCDVELTKEIVRYTCDLIRDAPFKSIQDRVLALTVVAYIAESLCTGLLYVEIYMGETPANRSERFARIIELIQTGRVREAYNLVYRIRQQYQVRLDALCDEMEPLMRQGYYR